MPEYSDYQRKVIDRYYDQRDSIMLQKLQDLASELFLAASDKQRDRLWQRVEKAMRNLKVKESIARHILDKRDPTVLAANVTDWLKQASK